MIGSDECRLDVGCLIFVFHIIECSHYRFLQSLLVICNENVIKAPFFLQDGSATMLALRIGKGGLYRLVQL